MQPIEKLTIKNTDFNLPECTDVYHGKVRDVYTIAEDILVIVATDRISAFDHILPKAIPYKGRILNAIAEESLQSVEDIVATWLIECPHPNVSIGYRCDPIKLEMVVRGYLAGHAWRLYKSGEREICGVPMPDGMQEGDRFPNPIVTPATKAEEGHDEDISHYEIVKQGIVSERMYQQLENYSLQLFQRGTEKAEEKGLLLVDTKYEFGLYSGSIMLMDEIHTPDSSRYYIKQGYKDRQEAGDKQIQLSKEFVREWLMENDFSGKEGQKMPVMPDDYVMEVSARYEDLYNKLMTRELNKKIESNELEIIEKAIVQWLKQYNN